MDLGWASGHLLNLPMASWSYSTGSGAMQRQGRGPDFENTVRRGWVKRSRSHHYWPSVTIQNWRRSSSFYFLGNSIEHCNCSSSRSSTVECEMSVKSHQKRALPLWLPLPLVHYPNRGECTPIQVFTHHGKLGTTFWGYGGNLRKRREFDKTKRTKENPSFSRSSFSLSTIPSLLLLYFLDLLLLSFHFLILQFLFLRSTAVPILSGIELHWNVLWCSWGFSHRWHSAKIEHRPILSPLSRLSSYVPSPPSSSSLPLSSSS